MSRKLSQTVQLKLRFPEKLRQRIESAAARNERSMNAEIVHRLDQSFQKDDLLAHQATLAEAAATTAVEKLLIVAGGKIGPIGTIKK
jgi:Arc-like DNA binding domain